MDAITAKLLVGSTQSYSYIMRIVGLPCSHLLSTIFALWQTQVITLSRNAYFLWLIVMNMIQDASLVGNN